MDTGWKVLALFIVIGVIRPLFWTVALSGTLWLGKRYLSEKAGRMVFGHYWDAGKRAGDKRPAA